MGDNLLSRRSGSKNSFYIEMGERGAKEIAQLFFDPLFALRVQVPVGARRRRDMQKSNLGMKALRQRDRKSGSAQAALREINRNQNFRKYRHSPTLPLPLSGSCHHGFNEVHQWAGIAPDQDDSSAQCP